MSELRKRVPPRRNSGQVAPGYHFFRHVEPVRLLSDSFSSSLDHFEREELVRTTSSPNTPCGLRRDLSHSSGSVFSSAVSCVALRECEEADLSRSVIRQLFSASRSSGDTPLASSTRSEPLLQPCVAPRRREVNQKRKAEMRSPRVGTPLSAAAKPRQMSLAPPRRRGPSTSMLSPITIKPLQSEGRKPPLPAYNDPVILGLAATPHRMVQREKEGQRRPESRRGTSTPTLPREAPAEREALGRTPLSRSVSMASDVTGLPTRRVNGSLLHTTELYSPRRYLYAGERGTTESVRVALHSPRIPVRGNPPTRHATSPTPSPTPTRRPNNAGHTGATSVRQYCRIASTPLREGREEPRRPAPSTAVMGSLFAVRRRDEGGALAAPNRVVRRGISVAPQRQNASSHGHKTGK